MKFSMEWLLSTCGLRLPARTLCDQLTMLGLEVDTCLPAAGELAHVVVGEVTAVSPHPNAKKLSCCTVSVGQAAALPIVCGAPNVAAGMRVAVAMIGAQLGDLTIQRAELRGVPSEGMLCAASELGIADWPGAGIMALPANAPVGMPLVEYMQLADQVITIELTPNRGDCLSIIGLARDMAACHATSFSPPAVPTVAPESDRIVPISVAVPTAAPRYLTQRISGVNPHAETPIAMREYLRRSGLQVVHPVVDVLNYVMLELGQPMHAFDADALVGPITVRYAHTGETMVCLADQAHTLSDHHLVIADTQGPVAVAGVIGAARAKVTAATTDIVIESAFFDPVVIRRSAKSLQCQTDASYRFERGVDYELPTQALARATALLLDMAGGLAGPVVVADSPAHLPAQPSISLSTERIAARLGVEFDGAWIVDTLTALGMQVTAMGESTWSVTVPSHRFDIAIEADLIEELARLHGYDQLPIATMRLPAVMLPQSEQYVTAQRLANGLVASGFYEVLTYSFISKDQWARFSRDNAPQVLANPLSAQLSTMRSSLLPGLLSALTYNARRHQEPVRLFEIGTVFSSEFSSVSESEHVGILLSGPSAPVHCLQTPIEADFYDLKGEVAALIAQTHRISDFTWRPATRIGLHPGRTAALYDGEHLIGYLGMLHPEVAQADDLDRGLYCFEGLLAPLQQAKVPAYTAISKYPAVTRDLALIADADLLVDLLLGRVEAVGGDLLKKITVFDLYLDDKLGKNKKSIGLSLTFEDVSRTLVDSEIDEHLTQILTNLKSVFGITLRV